MTTALRPLRQMLASSVGSFPASFGGFPLASFGDSLLASSGGLLLASSGDLPLAAFGDLLLASSGDFPLASFGDFPLTSSGVLRPASWGCGPAGGPSAPEPSPGPHTGDHPPERASPPPSSPTGSSKGGGHHLYGSCSACLWAGLTLSSAAVLGSMDWPIFEILLTNSTREGSSGVCIWGGGGGHHTRGGRGQVEWQERVGHYSQMQDLRSVSLLSS